MANVPDREPWTREQIVAKVERGLKDGMAKPRQVNTDRSKERKAQKGDSADRYAGGIRTALDLDQIEPPAYNVPGVLQENTTAVFWSPPGQLKTAHVVDLWARQSLGSIWREHALPPGLSLMIPLEDIAGFGARGRFWQKHHGLQLDARALWWQAPFDFSKECTAAVQEGIERAQDQHKLPLRSMFLDPILAAFGEGSASDDADFRRVLDSVNSLLENFKTATGVIVTHTSWEAKHEFGSMVQRALTATSVKFTVENEVSTLKLVRQKNDREGLEFHFKLVTGEEPGQVTVEALDQDEAATLRMPKRARLKKQGRSFWNALIYVWDSAQAADALHVPDNPEIAHSSKCAGGVRLGEVRVRFEALYGFESTANAQQKRARWSEGKNEVEVAGLCGFWKELVWPIFK
jgi:hypothetical protein